MAQRPSPAKERLRAVVVPVRANVAHILVAAFAGVAGLASSYGVAGFTPEFVAGPIAGFLSRQMPGPVVRFAITVLGDLGHKLNLLMGLSIGAGILGVIALSAIALGRRYDLRLVGTVVTAILGSVAAFLITGALAASVGAGVGAAAVVLLAEIASVGQIEEVSPGRRRMVGGAGSALTLAVGGYVIGEEGGIHGATVDATRDVGDADDAEMRASALLEEAASKSLDVEGLEPLVSTDFYEVDINATDPVVEADDWTLSVTGAVEREETYTYDEITELGTENRFVSLRCVGESLNGKKLDNAVWTGVPIMDVIESAGIPDECCVMLRAADDFYEEFPLDALEDGFLAYGMNGETLPRGHGYPVRALIPGHWGEINLKWLTEIEILEEEQDGYWEERGWHGTGPVKTVAKLHVENHLEDGRVEVAGHAYAGTRGIQQVEVSTDGGETWNEATLSEDLSGVDVWRQWVYRYEPPDGSHEVVVRATDGEGQLQTRERNDAFPRGATGWVSKEIEA